MNRRLAAILFLTAFAVPSAASAFSIEIMGTKVVRWADPNLTYYLEPNGAPGITDGSDMTAIQASFDGWQDIGCSALTFTKLGTTSNTDVLPIGQMLNDKNELIWINTSKWPFGEYVLGVTVAYPDWSGNIIESDIAFNGYSQKWSTSGGGWYTSDVKSVTIHELGHFFGQQHVLYGYDEWEPPTMATTSDPNGKTASLEPDDEMGACFLYPASGYYTCSSDAQCPKIIGHDSQGNEQYEGQLTCKNGYCSGVSGISPGSVEFGATCLKASDCASPATCVALNSGVKMCTRSCSPQNDDCPSGFHCDTLAATGTDMCVNGAKKKVEGEPCSKSYDCATAFCFPTPDGSGMFCRTACSKDASSCPAGQACWAATGSNTGGCFPADVVPSNLLPLDAQCDTSEQCKSGLCWAEPYSFGRCRKPCDLAAPVCYEGYMCADMGNGAGGACIPGQVSTKIPLGEACTANEECESAWCFAAPAASGLGSFCRKSCNLVDWACDWGFSCVSYGAAEWGVCMPSVEKAGLGEICGVATDCASLMCFPQGEGKDAYCTQTCIGGWCPEGTECIQDATFGEVCLLPAGTTPTVSEELPSDDTGGTSTETGKKGGGFCALGTTPAPAGIWTLLVLLPFGLNSLRRRRQD